MLVFELIVTVTVGVDPETSPDQWLKAHPAAGVAVTLTTVPASTRWDPTAGLVDPSPSRAIVRRYLEAGGPDCTKCAVTDLFPFIVTDVGLLDPVTLPLQRWNSQPVAAVAESVTTVPSS